MARYYFHLVNQHDAVPDEDGLELIDLAKAGDEILLAVQEFRRENPPAADGWRGWRLNVADGSGAVVFSISLDEPSYWSRRMGLSLCALMFVEDLKPVADVFTNLRGSSIRGCLIVTLHGISSATQRHLVWDADLRRYTAQSGTAEPSLIWTFAECI
jgi:hypothetical protein